MTEKEIIDTLRVAISEVEWNLSARLHDSFRRSYKADKAENKAASERTQKP